MNTFQKMLIEIDKQIDKEYADMQLSDVEIQYRKVISYVAQKTMEETLINGICDDEKMLMLQDPETLL